MPTSKPILIEPGEVIRALTLMTDEEAGELHAYAAAGLAAGGPLAYCERASEWLIKNGKVARPRPN